jgi:hypothetical protein
LNILVELVTAIANTLKVDFGDALRAHIGHQKELGHLYLVFIIAARNRREKKDIPSLKSIVFQ